MNKRTKLAVLIGAIAAVVSAIILIIVFWDKLLAKCPCRKNQEEDLFDDVEVPEAPAEEEAEVEVIAYTEEETADFADLGEPEAEPEAEEAPAAE